MNTSRFREWYSSKVQTADEIVNNRGDTAEPDAEIILCCANSGLAALMWPGDRIDKFRFTQFLVEYASPQTNIQRVSIPVLIGRLETDGDNTAAMVLRRQFYPQSDLEIVDGDKVDQLESVVKGVLPHIATKDLRESSCAGIIYLDLRCGLVHEYRLSTYLASFSMSSRTNVPSYVNMLVEPNEVEVKAKMQEFGISEELVRAALAKHKRRMHLPYEYVRNVMVSSADAAFAYWDSATSWERPEPATWWIQG
jgi:hypothetical protein